LLEKAGKPFANGSYPKKAFGTCRSPVGQDLLEIGPAAARLIPAIGEALWLRRKAEI
jgi:hypothetical protein